MHNGPDLKAMLCFSVVADQRWARAGEMPVPFSQGVKDNTLICAQGHSRCMICRVSL